jgi:hypothetical protein
MANQSIYTSGLETTGTYVAAKTLIKNREANPRHKDQPELWHCTEI